MASLHNMKPEKVIKTFGRAGWRYDRRANMENLNEDQIKRQDFVDNKIYELVNQLVPSEKKIGWNIEMIGDIRDTIQHWLVDRYRIVNELEFYPYV
jgi:hypothetical protein